MIKFEDGERSLLIIRRHWFVMLPTFFIILILSAAPLLLNLFLNSDFLSNGFYGGGYDFEKIKLSLEEYIIFAYSIWLLFLWIFFFIEWTDYYLDIWIVTDRRIIDVEQKGFFNREVTSFSFRQIQDITVETKGLLETFLKFGDLHIQTAGHNRQIFIKDAYYPEDARALILKLQEQLIKN